MMADVARGALGAILGGTLGAPHRGRKAWRRLRFFEPIPSRMSPHHTLDAWLPAAKHLKERGKPELYAKRLIAHWHSSEEGSRFGLANVRAGLTAPLSGSIRNPLPFGSEAFGRAAFWGLAFHGSPDEAAKWAMWDASIDHEGRGADLPAAIAWMIASPEPATRSLPGALAIADDAVNPAIEALLAKIESPDDAYRAMETHLKDFDTLDAARTFCHIALGALCGESFEDACCLAVSCGGATDQAGVALGAWAGARMEIPSEWRAVASEDYVGSHSLRHMPSPETIEEWTRWLEEARTIASPEPAPTPEEERAEVEVEAAPEPEEDKVSAEEAPDEEPVDEADSADQSEEPSDKDQDISKEAEIEEPVDVPMPSLDWRPEEGSTFAEAHGCLLRFALMDRPTVAPSTPISLALRFSCDEEKEVRGKITEMPNWAVKTRMPSSFKVQPDHCAEFPAILLAQESSALREMPFLRMNRREVPLPLLRGERWWIAGPFKNDAGEAFEQVIKAESEPKLDWSFNGRSNLPCPFQEHWLEGRMLDLEPLFVGGPGALVLWARIALPKPGRYQIVVASDVGAIVRVDGEVVRRYHDDRPNVPRAVEPFTASFDAGETTQVVIKALRNRRPTAPLAVYFMDMRGDLVEPKFLPLG